MAGRAKHQEEQEEQEMRQEALQEQEQGLKQTRLGQVRGHQQLAPDLVIVE